MPRAKKPKAPLRPRNVAARALREGQFQPKVEKDPRAYTRKPRHKEPLVPEEDGGEGDPPQGN